MHFKVITAVLIVFSQFIFAIVGRKYFEEVHRCKHDINNLRSVVQQIIKQIAAHSNCIVFITDPLYRGLIDVHSIETSSPLSKYDIAVRDSENFSRPSKLFARTLEHIKTENCDAYVILIANGLLASRFLQYVEG